MADPTTSHRAGLRDRIAVRLADASLRLASKQYRDFLAEVITLGFKAAEDAAAATSTQHEETS